MKTGWMKGFGFGLTSGVITPLGLIINLHSGTQSKLAVIVGIIISAIADALSDAMGIHVSEEAEGDFCAHVNEGLGLGTKFLYLPIII